MSRRYRGCKNHLVEDSASYSLRTLLSCLPKVELRSYAHGWTRGRQDNEDRAGDAFATVLGLDRSRRTSRPAVSRTVAAGDSLLNYLLQITNVVWRSWIEYSGIRPRGASGLLAALVEGRATWAARQRARPDPIPAPAPWGWLVPTCTSFPAIRSTANERNNPFGDQRDGDCFVNAFRSRRGAGEATHFWSRMPSRLRAHDTPASSSGASHGCPLMRS
jgi:hypothetical protein